MSDNNRLEKIKKRVLKNKDQHKNIKTKEPYWGYSYELSDKEYNWLIENVELMQQFAQKNAELNEFLGKNCEAKYFGKNVIDVAIDVISKQAERIQELEEIIEQDERQAVLEGLYEENKRYQEALESLVKQETLGKDIKTGKTAISYNGMIALKGLSIFDDGEYVVYGADEIIESVLEGEE